MYIQTGCPVLFSLLYCSLPKCKQLKDTHQKYQEKHVYEFNPAVCQKNVTLKPGSVLFFGAK